MPLNLMYLTKSDILVSSLDLKGVPSWYELAKAGGAVWPAEVWWVAFLFTLFLGALKGMNLAVGEAFKQ